MSFLSEKYENVLNEYNSNQHEMLAEVLERSVNYIKNTYGSYDKLQKIAASYLIVELWVDDKITTSITSIEEYIDEFMANYNNSFSAFKEKQNKNSVEDINKNFVKKYIKEKFDK